MLESRAISNGNRVEVTVSLADLLRGRGNLWQDAGFAWFSATSITR
jgi:hypothetical protein